jgi:hypothetical protein
MLNFTVVYDDLVNNDADVSGDVDAVAVTGPVAFIPAIRTGARIPAPNNLPRPAGLALRTFPAFLDADGQLKTEPGGVVGVRLWANDPDWNLDRLQYLVRANLTDQLGNAVPWAPFAFDAPTEDVTIDLTNEMPQPGQKFSRGRAGYGFARDGVSIDGLGQLVFTREDGAELAVVPIPEDLSGALAAASADALALGLTFVR